MPSVMTFRIVDNFNFEQSGRAVQCSAVDWIQMIHREGEMLLHYSFPDKGTKKISGELD